MFVVFVENLEFYAYHGVPAEERTIGHRYRVSVRLDVDGRANETDSVSDTVDYAQVAQTIEVVSSSQQYFTVERLADAMGQALLAHFAKVEAVWLRVEKRLPPAEMMADGAGVEVMLERERALS